MSTLPSRLHDRVLESIQEEQTTSLSMLAVSRALVTWSSFAFAVLQSVCTFFTALSGLRLIVGVGALATITQAGVIWDHLHADWIRVPMILIAFAGSLLNLLILRRIRRLRSHPAAQWRQTKPSRRKIASEQLQFVLALLTLALIGVEEITHFRTFHRF